MTFTNSDTNISYNIAYRPYSNDKKYVIYFIRLLTALWLRITPLKYIWGAEKQKSTFFSLNFRTDDKKIQNKIKSNLFNKLFIYLFKWLKKYFLINWFIKELNGFILNSFLLKILKWFFDKKLFLFENIKNNYN